MNLADYVITPVDVWRGLKSLGWIRGILLIAGIVAAIAASRFGISPGVITALLVLYMAYILQVDARVPFVIAIALLIGIAVLSAFDVSQASDRDSLQNNLAVYAYYCLVLGVLLLIRDQVMPQKYHPMRPDARRNHSNVSSRLLHTHGGPVANGIRKSEPKFQQAKSPTHANAHSSSSAIMQGAPSVAPRLHHRTANRSVDGLARQNSDVLRSNTNTIPAQSDKMNVQKPIISQAPIQTMGVQKASTPKHPMHHRRHTRDSRIMDFVVAQPQSIHENQTKSMPKAPQTAPRATIHAPSRNTQPRRNYDQSVHLYGRTIQ